MPYLFFFFSLFVTFFFLIRFVVGEVFEKRPRKSEKVKEGRKALPFWMRMIFKKLLSFSLWNVLFDGNVFWCLLSYALYFCCPVLSRLWIAAEFILRRWGFCQPTFISLSNLSLIDLTHLHFVANILFFPFSNKFRISNFTFKMYLRRIGCLHVCLSNEYLCQ